MPVWRYQHIDEDRLVTKSDDEDEQPVDATGNEKKGDSERNDSEVSRDDDGAGQDEVEEINAAQPLVSKRHKAESASCAVDEPAVTKDWALECYHTYQHLHFATQYIMRSTPKHTSFSARIVYHLPSAARALLIDHINSWAIHDVLSVCTTQLFSVNCWSSGLLQIDYTACCHHAYQPLCADATWKSKTVWVTSLYYHPSHAPCRLSTLMEAGAMEVEAR